MGQNGQTARRIVFCVLILCVCFTSFMFVMSRIFSVPFSRIFTSDASPGILSFLDCPGLHYDDRSPCVPVHLCGTLSPPLGVPAQPWRCPCSEKAFTFSQPACCPLYFRPQALFTQSRSRMASALSSQLPYFSLLTCTH